MMTQVVASPMIVILTTLEVSFMPLKIIYCKGIIHDERHRTIIMYLLYRPMGVYSQKLNKYFLMQALKVTIYKFCKYLSQIFSEIIQHDSF